MNSEARKSSRVTFVCSSCGSHGVVVDAWAEWDVTNQRWELAQTFDAGYCRTCDEKIRYCVERGI